MKRRWKEGDHWNGDMGACLVCNGNGYLTIPSAGSFDESWVTCRACEGSGEVPRGDNFVDDILRDKKK